MTASRSAPAQRPEVDGLRAFAILPVVFFHAGLGFPGGFVGVDVFFVISGFLIGGIILREVDAGGFSFARFWERRFRRIVPILLFFLATTLALGRVFLLPTDLQSLGAQAVSALFGIANFKMLALTGGYWAKPAGSLILLHTWSLAVEEQFYVVMPIILVLCHRWWRSKVHWVIIFCLTTSLCLSLYLSANISPANFYLLPSRAWELLLGCLGAWITHQQMGWRGRAAEIAIALGLIAVVAASAAFHIDSLWPDYRALLPTVGTLSILISRTEDSSQWLSTKILLLPPIRFVGLISYSLYLWHWPFIVFLNQYGAGQLTFTSQISVVLVSVAVAAASWKFIEQPFRNKSLSFRAPIKPLLASASLVWIILFVISRKFAAPDAIISSNLPRTLTIGKGVESIAEYDATPLLEQGGVIINSADASPRCVVVGISHA